ncbi:MAG: NAD(P)H-dependent oxidoreductase [Pseudomonadota bacterium]|nr:NAD(P)H-dependent oxidoreductase [Pseudomonadota bacterium]
MSNVVVISGHPDLQSSNTNTVILERIAQALDSVSIRHLDQLYPHYQIDVAAEQQALLDADIIILQFPFYWYSVPALLKKWIDDVFSYDFAYGSGGDKLQGKDFLLSFTIGGPEEEYNALGHNHFEIGQFLRPLQQTAYLAGMNFIKPVYTHRMIYIPDVYNELSEVQARAEEHAARLIDTVKELQNSPAQRIHQFVQKWFSDFDALEEDSTPFTKHLAVDAKLLMPEGEFIGHEGFRDWYAFARRSFKPNAQHHVKEINIDEVTSGNYKVELKIELLAETYSDSDFGGENINMLVNEVWQLSFNDNGEITIHSYVINPS